MDLAQEIKRLAESKLTEGQFLVDVIISTRSGPKKVMIIADADQGFTIENCAELNRYLSVAMDESALIDDNYILEVSTPGLDQPLKLNRQYHKNIGRSLKVKLRDNNIIEGKLISVSDTQISLTQEVGSGKKKEIKTLEVSFLDIEKAFVMVSFK